MGAGAVHHEDTPRKRRAAALSIASNSALILLKLVAGVVTGSVAIVTEAVHSGIDLIASIVAYFSVRKAGEPADESHRYGHEKIEHLAAAIEGMLILVGSGIIVFESVRRLIVGGTVEHLGFGIAVVAFSAVANLVVSATIGRTARATASPALEGDAAHLRTDAYTSMAVLAGLALVQLTGAEWLDPRRRAARRGRDRPRGRAAADGLLARARRRGAAGGGARRDPRGGGRVRRARRGRLPPAAHAPGGRAPLRRPAPPVRGRHLARAGARDRACDPGRDRARGWTAPTC